MENPNKKDKTNNPWNSDLWTSEGLNNGGVADLNRGGSAKDTISTYYDTYNRGVANRRKSRNQNFLDQAKKKAEGTNSYWDTYGKDLNIRNYDKNKWGTHESVMQKNLDQINNYGSLAGNINPNNRAYNYQTDIAGMRGLGRSFADTVKAQQDAWVKENWNPETFDLTAMGGGAVTFDMLNRARFLADTYGFDEQALKDAGYEFAQYSNREGRDFNVIDPYELLKNQFMESYQNNFDGGGWEKVLNGNAGASQFATYLSKFGAQNAQDAEIMARLGMGITQYGDEYDGTFTFNTDDYTNLEGDFNSELALIRKDAEEELNQLLQLKNDYTKEQETAETYLNDLSDQMGTMNAEALAEYLNNIDNAYIEDVGGNEKYFNQFFSQYNDYNDFAQSIRDTQSSLMDQVSGLSIRDLEALTDGRQTLDNLRNSIENYQTDLTGLDTESLYRLLDEATKNSEGTGYQDLLDRRAAEESNIQSVRDMLSNRDEELGELIDDSSMYNKDLLDELKGRFDELNKYRSDYEGDDRFTSELDFDFSAEFGDIDAELQELMGIYGERDSALSALLMDGDESLSDRLSGVAENDLSGFDDLRSLLTDNANELSKFTGDDLDDENEALTELLEKAQEGRQNIFDERSNLESELSDLYDTIKEGNFYSLDDVQSGRGQLDPFNERKDYWDAGELTKDEFDLINSFFDSEKGRIETDMANVAARRRMEQLRTEELLNQRGGELRFNNKALVDLSDEQIAELYQRSKNITDDPDELVNSIWDLVGVA